MSQEVAYRYEDRLYSVTLDADREEFGSRVDLALLEFPVIKHTPCGFWIDVDFFAQEKKFVRTTANKRYACLTLQEAIDSFLARKRRQHRIYAAKVRNIEEAQRLGQRVKENLK